MTDDELMASLKRSLDARRDIRYAVLFGSAATRGVAAARDVDVALAFSAPLSLMEEAALATELESAVGLSVDVVDLDRASTLLRWEVAQTGRPITVVDRDSWVDFSARIAMEWDDLRPLFELESEGLRRALLKESRWSGSPSSSPRSPG